VLPFFFGRQRLAQEALPMIAIREGLVRIHVTLRPFDECVRQLRGWRDSCTATPLAQPFTFVAGTGDAGVPLPRTVVAAAVSPPFKSVQLVTYGAILDGPYRQKMLREPFETMHRVVQTFTFDEPLKYAVGKRAESDTIRIQLPLEANHPIEEIVWFVRRKGVRDNNAWTNFTSVLEQEWLSVNGTAAAAARPLLLHAAIQMNGITVCDAEEQYYRQLIAKAHRGGFAAYGSYLYGYPFARYPGEHQPTGTANASKLNTLRLTLDVRPPGGVLDAAWEVKVVCFGLNWMRYEHGLANPVFAD
jgi:hypothetical protein